MSQYPKWSCPNCKTPQKPVSTMGIGIHYNEPTCCDYESYKKKRMEEKKKALADQKERARKQYERRFSKKWQR